MKRVNILIAFVLLVFAGYYAWLTAALPDRNLPNTMGIDFFPWVLCAALTGLSLLLLIKSLFFKTSETCMYRVEWIEIKEMLIFLVLTVAYLQALDYLGFIILTPVYIATLMIGSGSRRWKEIALISLLTTVGIYFFFDKVFQVILPGGKLL
ncbi:MAG: tripartite tricarboxylate transporter TctB family protein [Thermodesulfobacteriota bacterium]